MQVLRLIGIVLIDHGTLHRPHGRQPESEGIYAIRAVDDRLSRVVESSLEESAASKRSHEEIVPARPQATAVHPSKIEVVNPSVRSLISDLHRTQVSDGGNAYAIRVTSKGGRVLHNHSRDGRFEVPVIQVRPGGDMAAEAASAILDAAGFSIPSEAFKAGGIDAENGRRIIIADATAGRQVGKPKKEILWLKMPEKNASGDPMIATLIKNAAITDSASKNLGEQLGERLGSSARTATDYVKNTWAGMGSGQKAGLIAGGLIAGGATFAALRKKKHKDGSTSGSNWLAAPAALIAAAGGAALGAYGGGKAESAIRSRMTPSATLDTPAASPEASEAPATPEKPPAPAAPAASETPAAAAAEKIVEKQREAPKVTQLAAAAANESVKQKITPKAKPSAAEISDARVKNYRQWMTNGSPLDNLRDVGVDRNKLRSSDAGSAAVELVQRGAPILGGDGKSHWFRTMMHHGPLDTLRGAHMVGQARKGDNAMATALGFEASGFNALLGKD